MVNDENGQGDDAVGTGITRRAVLASGGALGALALGLVLPQGVASADAPSSRPGSGLRHVDPFIGTQVDHGKTSPFAGVPFGMTQWAPSTSTPATKGVAPYLYGDSTLVGFRGSHWPSGSAMQDYGSVTLMPESGTLRTAPAERAVAFSHADESATPSHYRVRMADGITVELTGTARAGFMRFTFPSADRRYVVVDSDAAYEPSGAPPKGEGWIQAIPERREIVGCNPVHRLYQGSGQSANISGYFVVRFQETPAEYGTWNLGEQPQAGVLRADDRPGAYAGFDVSGSRSLLVTVGTSFVSVEGARANLDAEIRGWDFDATQESARRAWDEALGRVNVTGGSPGQQTIFATALYHTMLLPRLFSDVDGSCPAFDTGEIVHSARPRYMDFSMWDTFRAVHPLLALLQPERVNDIAQSLVDMGSEGGWLPIFPMWNNYTSEMIGDHVIATLADTYLKGFRDFDVTTAYRLMRQNAYALPDHDQYVLGKGRRALDSYLKYGYIPLEDPVADAFHKGEQVSRTLEYAYDDFTLARLAESLGKHDDAADLLRRATWYRNVIDPSIGAARGRHADGSWVTPADPLAAQTWITESTPWIYTSFVPHDVAGLATLLGGRDRLRDHLVTTFENSATTGFTGAYYDHGNEPSHHVSYLFNHVGAPYLTQKWVRHIMDTAYQATPDGLLGDDDAGQTSAWFVFSAIGLYPVCPGVPYYSIGSPLFDTATLRVSSQGLPRSFTVVAQDNSPQNVYIQEARLNGKPLGRPWLTHAEVVAGGVLTLRMGPRPNTRWGSDVQAAPPSLTDDPLT
jgi:predicted alpha-1,2-mannosidase